jgi:hypothetical protein
VNPGPVECEYVAGGLNMYGEVSTVSGIIIIIIIQCRITLE